MDRAGEPATELQLTCLRHYGYAPDHPLTKHEATDLIHQLQHHPQPEPPPAHPGISATTRTAAYRFHLAIRENGSSPANPAPATGPGQAASEREEFWQDTCGEAGHMHLASVPVMELYSNFGCRFFPPTREQVKEILQALDAAMPFWDRDHPDLFYQTLELNFPTLVRHASL